MKLYNGPTSPFGRKASVVYRELGLAVEEVTIDVYTAEFLDALNPLRQIPTLELDDGRPLYGSTVIALYFIALAERQDVCPEEQKWDILTACALCDGLMEAVLQRRMETLRPDGEKSPSAIAKLETRAERAVSSLAAGLHRFEGNGLRLDRIATVCALEYTSFRLSSDWKTLHPSLAAWAEAYGKHRGFVATRPKS
jgi:glutathione S-transferase